MNIEPTSIKESLAFLLLFVILPLLMLWLLHRVSSTRAPIWKLYYMAWVVINFGFGLYLIAVSSISLELGRLREGTWILEDVLFALFAVALPFAYALLGVVSYYQNYIETTNKHPVNDRAAPRAPILH